MFALNFSSALDFDVLVADFTEERLPRRADYATQKDAAERARRVHLRLRIHQPPGGEPQAEDDDLLHRDVPGELLACVALDGGHLARQNGRLVSRSGVRSRFLLRWDFDYGDLLQVSS